MPSFTLTDEEFRRLLAAARTDAEKDALAEMVKAANDIDQARTLGELRDHTAEFIGPMDRLASEMAKLSGNAGLLQSPDIKAVRQRLVDLKKQLGIEVADADDDMDSEAAEAADVATAAAGPMPATATADGGFEAFFATNLPDVTHFSASEFLYKGATHETNGLNTDPPEALWPNMIPLARVLEQLRGGIGAPVRLLSVYRSPAYNSAVGGATGSQHLQFKAADFVAGTGTPANWAERLRGLRSAGAFSGGIGIYGTFVHVDVRGTDADWTG